MLTAAREISINLKEIGKKDRCVEGEKMTGNEESCGWDE